MRRKISNFTRIFVLINLFPPQYTYIHSQTLSLQKSFDLPSCLHTAQSRGANIYLTHMGITSNMEYFTNSFSYHIRSIHSKLLKARICSVLWYKDECKLLMNPPDLMLSKTYCVIRIIESGDCTVCINEVWSKICFTQKCACLFLIYNVAEVTERRQQFLGGSPWKYIEIKVGLTPLYPTAYFF